MNLDIIKKFGKKDIILIFTILIGLSLIYLGVFFIYYTSDEITSITKDDYWEWEWETHRPYVILGRVVFMAGLILSIVGSALMIWRWSKIVSANRKV